MKKLACLIPLLIVTAIVGWAQDTNAVYEKNCASCHGKDGKGQTKAGRKAGVKDLTDQTYQGSFTDEAAFKAIKEGLMDASGKEHMKPYGDKITDAEIHELVTYIRAMAK